jgi:hypothetical protein
LQGRHGHLSAEQKQLAFRLRSQGWRLTDIAKEIGCTGPMVGIMVRTGRHVDAKPFGWEPREGGLTIAEREQILLGIGRGESLSSIARAPDAHPRRSLARSRTMVVASTTPPGTPTSAPETPPGGQSPTSSAGAGFFAKSPAGSRGSGRPTRLPVDSWSSSPMTRRCA